MSNNSDSNNRPFENEVSMRENLDKKSSPQSLSKIYNKSVTQGKRETHETARKTSADANQYDVQDYKDYKGKQFLIKW